MNTYGYVGGNPVNFIDPLGLELTVGNGQNIIHLPDGAPLPNGGEGVVSMDGAGSPIGVGGIVGEAAAAACPPLRGAKAATTVIGRTKDLKNLLSGERSLLNRLPNLGNPKANWAQNSGVLREQMARGQPIRDVSPGDTSGAFLNAERNLLQDRGWTFDSNTNFWNPPKP